MKHHETITEISENITQMSEHLVKDVYDDKNILAACTPKKWAGIDMCSHGAWLRIHSIEDFDGISMTDKSFCFV